MIVQKNVSALLKRIPSVPIVLIVLLGAILRFTNLNWDSYLAFHPDERNIAWAVTRIHFFTQMNPKFFAYGGLPIYLYRALGELVATITHNPRWYTDWGAIAVVGRYVSATLSTTSILLIYLVGRSYFTRAAGLASAVGLAFSPWAIREAHFATTETVLVFFLLLLLLLSRRLSAAGSPDLIRATSAAGLVWGLALAAKTTSLLFGLIPLTALWIPIFDKTLIDQQFVKTVSRRLLWTLLLLSVATIIFFLFSPYTILDGKHFLESMTYESGVAMGRFTVPYTLQFLHTVPYLYQLETMLWQAGPAAILGIVGILTLFCFSTLRILRGDTLFRASSRPRHKNIYGDVNGLDLDDARNTARPPAHIILFLIFPLLYFAWVGTWFAKFSRYNVPVLPFLTLAAAWLLVFVFKKIPKRSSYWFIGLFVYLIIGLFHVWWGLANWSIYLRPQTRIAASEWIYANIPSQSIIYTEHWNDGLPVSLPAIAHPGYNHELLNVYDEPDNEKKLAYYMEKLPKGDYFILSTPRIWRTMPQLIQRYPLTSRLYQKLFSGELGYSEVARFSSYPTLFGVTIPDDTAEETIQVFDHPTVVIFKNTKHLSKEEIEKRLTGT